MNLDERTKAFIALGEKLKELAISELEELAGPAKAQNGWFTPESITQSIRGIAFMLTAEKLDKWLDDYHLKPEVPKIVGIIMAGNIPLVGFHDLMCVLLSGNIAAIKMSSQDSFLMTQMIEWICEVEPRFKRNIDVREKLDEVDAVIATGSDNTARYFEYYFGKYPNIIRKNRTAICIIDGTESEEELKALGSDIFSYYGLGCRNISKVFTPKGYDITQIFPHLEAHQEVAFHNKYRNNYDYYKSNYLVNKTPHLDTGFLLVLSTDDLVAPTSVLYHQEYETKESLLKILDQRKEKIQCIIGHGHIPFGQAQSPEPWDYADGIDTLQFLEDLG